MIGDLEWAEEDVEGSCRYLGAKEARCMATTALQNSST